MPPIAGNPGLGKSGLRRGSRRRPRRPRARRSGDRGYWWTRKKRRASALGKVNSIVRGPAGLVRSGVQSSRLAEDSKTVGRLVATVARKWNSPAVVRAMAARRGDEPWEVS